MGNRDNRNKRRGFTLIEILTALVVMTIISGAAMMSITSAKQTPKREAERIQAYIQRKMQRADRMHKFFKLDLGKSDRIDTVWEDQEANKEEDFKANDDFYYTNDFKNKSCNYYFSTKQFNKNGTITVTRNDGETYYVKIHMGRIRISEDNRNL